MRSSKYGVWVAAIGVGATLLVACGTASTTETPAPAACEPSVEPSFFASAKSPPSFVYPDYSRCSLTGNARRFTTASELAAGCTPGAQAGANGEGDGGGDAEAGAPAAQPWAEVEFSRSDVIVVQICSGISVVEVGAEVWFRSQPSCPLGADPCGPFPSYRGYVIPKSASFKRQVCRACSNN